MSLPISLILPTRNALGAIEAHLDEILPWLPAMAQIIVVDSSEDGTLDYLRERLAGISAVEFHARPRGLYAGWNFGVNRATAEYVYFSTVGDVIDEPGLRHLLEVAVANQADMVLSPPRMIDDAGAPHPRRWPVHALSSEMDADTVTLAPMEAFLLSTSFIPATVLGSSASNLYRREFLRERPFPEDAGHDADSAWMISHSLEARVSVTKRTVARFVVHAKEVGDIRSQALTRERYEKMAARAGEVLRASDLPADRRTILAGWNVVLNDRYLLFIDRLAAATGHLQNRNERIETLSGQNERLKAELDATKERLRTVRETLADSRAQVERIRDRLMDLDRRHRSFLGVMGLYFGPRWKGMKARLRGRKGD